MDSNKDSLPKEGVRKESIRKESGHKESLPKESVRKESGHKESLPKENVRKESGHKESLPKENVRKESGHKESLPKENVRKESGHKESLPREGVHKESMDKEIVHKDSLRKDSARKDSERKDSARKDSARKDSARKDSSRKDSAHKDSAHKDSAHKESLHKEGVHREGVHKEHEEIPPVMRDHCQFYDDLYLHLNFTPLFSHGCTMPDLKWRRTPRSSRYFRDSDESSSFKDSDYERWLENYYDNLDKERKKKEYEEKGTQTVVEDEDKSDFATSLFQPVEKDMWSFSTKYWGPKDMRRHWPLRLQRNKYLFLPTIHPHLNIRSRYGRFHSLLNSAAALPEMPYQKLVCGVFRKVLFNVELISPQLREFMICDLLCNFKWFDYMSKMATVRMLCKLLRKQCHLEKVYLENLNLDRKEGIILLCALSRNAGDVVKEIHIWRMFGYAECPVLMHNLSPRGDILPVSASLKFFTRVHFLQVLNNFIHLTTLSINYAYLANRRGDVLLHLKCIRLGYLQKLRILCTKDERPFLTNPGLGAGGWKIPDGVWKRVAELCPELRVAFVFLNLPQYENVILFLSKSIPMSHVYLSSGMDLQFQVPWDIDSTLLELRNWYADTLECLSLHLWRHRDLLDYVIKCKILDEFPNLVNFEFIGVLEDVETLEDFCYKLSEGNYKLKCLMFWVEEEQTERTKLSLTRQRVDEINSKYKRKFLVLEIDADLQTYNGCSPVFNEVRRLCRSNEFVGRSLMGLPTERRENYISYSMKGKHLVVSISSIPPYIYYIVRDDAVVLQGSFGQLWNTLEERLGFTSEYMIESYSTGVLNFINKRRDVLLRPSVISSDDVDQFDFTYHIGRTWYACFRSLGRYEIYLKDSDEINSSNSYVRNWSMDIWILTGVMIFLFTFLLYFMLYISDKFLLRDMYIVPKFQRVFSIIQNRSLEDNKFNLPRNWRKMKKEYEKLKTKSDKSLGNCLIAAISVFCSQGIYLPTKVTSVRLAMLSFLIFGMIMYDSYSALLVSQLTLGERFLPFDTLEEIPLKGNDYSLCVRPESYPYLYFTVNKSGNGLQEKWENIVNRKPCPSDGIFDLEEICQPYVAFLEAPAVMKEYSLRYKNCKLMSLRGRYFNADFALMILKGFEDNAKKEINKEILRYREVGILSYLKEKWIEQYKITSEPENQKLQVTFEHVKGILLVYICCLGFCSSLFFIETLIYVKERKRKILLERISYYNNFAKKLMTHNNK